MYYTHCMYYAHKEALKLERHKGRLSASGMWRARHLEFLGQLLRCPKLVRSQTTNGNSSRSQHGELMLLPRPERLTKPHTSALQRTGIQNRVRSHHRKKTLYVLCILYLLFCFRRMVEFVWIPDFLLCLLGTQARFRITCALCATCFQAHLATAGRVLAMDGSSTRGQWHGPETCNEWEVELGQCQPPRTILIEQLI